MAKTLEIAHVYPSTPSSDSLSDVSLPLTFFDTFWFKFHPVERLFFYYLPQPKQTFLDSTIPKLKHSLSLTLHHFLPLAGNLTWPKDCPKPIILYTPNDGVSLTVAESDNAEDFDILSGDHARKAASFHPFVPKLKVTETGASVIALQITMFPNRGFCIGVTCHHAVLDGKSMAMFIKSWAHLCRSEEPGLPSELTPFFDRSVIRDPYGLDILYLNKWLSLSKTPDPKDDPNLFQFFPIPELPSDSVRATFELSKGDIAKLRRKLSSKWEKLEPTTPTKPHFSSFVLTFAHALVCILKAMKSEEETIKEKIFFGFIADLRGRPNLTPPVPENYFGNCVRPLANFEDARELLKEEDAFTAAALKTGELIKELTEKDFMEGAKEMIPRMASPTSGGARGVGVAGSPRFGVYGVDFGWGKPKKVEIVSLERGGAISMAESRDGNGGIEIGLILNKPQMDVFSCCFSLV